MNVRDNTGIIYTLLTAAAMLSSASCTVTDAGNDTQPQHQPDSGSDTEYPDVSRPLLSIQTYPRVDGSTSAEPLQVLIACKLLGVEYDWETHYDDSNRLRAKDPDKEETVEFINSTILHNGTHDAYVRLIEDQADLILVARQPSQDELALALTHNVALELDSVAQDAFVFIMNAANPVNGLTTSQVQEIYTGQLTNWNEVGGNDADINPYQRNANSGSQELMETLVMQDLNMIDAPDMILQGMMGPINQISMDEDGFGYSVYFYEQFMAPNEDLELCGVDGVVPSYDTIQSGAYRFATDVYVVVKQDLGPDTEAFKLKEWLFSKDGQNIVHESGYVPRG